MIEYNYFYDSVSKKIYVIKADGSQDHLVLPSFGLIGEAEIVKYTEQRIAEMQSKITPEQLAIQARAKRDALLASSDYTQVPDSPILNKAAWANYRQALRDISTQVGFPTFIIWPTPPQG